MKKKEQILDHRCYCACHKDRGFKHVIMCCVYCEICGMDVARYLMPQHKPWCKARHKEMMKELRRQPNVDQQYKERMARED